MLRFLLRLRAPVCAAALALAATAVAAQDSFPSRPVTIVVPYTPGGVTDLYARAIGNQLAQRWKQPVLVENKPGAGTILGTQYVAQGPADGYNILLTSYAFTSNQVLMRKLPYDPAALTPLVLLGNSHSILVLGTKAPAHTLKEVIAQARAQPGGLRLASSGNGSSPHVGEALFASLIDADVTHVPYKGTAPAMNDVMGGQVDGIFDGPSSMASVRAGKLRAIAIAAPQRHPFAPDVPTFRELGLDLVTGSWFGFFVSSRTPEETKRRIYDDLRAVLAMPETHAQIDRGGLAFSQATPQEFQDFLQQELVRLQKLVANPKLHFEIE